MKLGKRFWKAAEATEVDGGWQVTLDGRPVRTPVGAPFLAPNRAMGAAAAAEWDAQGEKIDPLSMPVTRAVNVTLDRVIPERAAVDEIVAAYGETDLLCYRADWPEVLAARQAEGWDPLLDWAQRRHGARLVLGAGVMHVAQPEASTAALRAAVESLDPFALTALHELVALSGSLVLGLAVLEGEIDAETAWALSRIDEEYQIEQWGHDDEADALAARRKADFLQAAAFHRLLMA